MSAASSQLQTNHVENEATAAEQAHTPCDEDDDDDNYVPLAERLPPLPDDGTRRIFLIRHGETDWNALGKMQGGGFDLELNGRGRAQAARLAQEMSRVRPALQVVASSHLQRARATADAVAARHSNARRVVLPGLGEMRFGEFEGRALRGPECTKEITVQFQRVNNRMKEDPHARWPGGESLAEVEERSLAALNEILQQPAGDRCRSIGIVAHGRTINILLASLLEKDCRKFHKFHQRNCCINVLDVSPTWEYKSLILNYYDHIER